MAATACLATALAQLLGGPGGIGLVLLAAGVAAAAGVALLAARRPRPLRDDTVAMLDRAAGLGGSLRSAHWFALQNVGSVLVPHPAARNPRSHEPRAGLALQALVSTGAQSPDPGARIPAEVFSSGDRNASWIARHLEEAASRGAQVNWGRVYERPSAPLSWTLALACGLATLGLSARPLPRLLRPSARTVEAVRDPAPTGPGAAKPATALAPQVLEGIKAMSSGRTPSDEQLSAIGRVLEVAKYDAAARRQIEAEVSGSATKRTTQYSSSESDSANSAWSDDFNNGFEIGDLDWAYQEAMARVHMEERAHPEPGGAAPAAEAAGNAMSDARPGQPSAAGSMAGAPVAADTRGQPINFSSLLLGRQHASGDAVATNSPQDPGRAVKLSAALRNEVVHASSDFTGPDLDIPAARRATKAEPKPVASALASQHIRYDRSRAAQPPSIPGARRLLVHDFFRRPAEAVPTAKRR